MPAGRPHAEIDKKQFENLCGLQCTYEEICGWFGVTDKTLNGWCKRTYGKKFSEVFSEKRGNGRISLRRMQWRLAERSASMAIFLGKQFLGQRDNVNVALERDMEDDPISKALKEEADHGPVSEAEADP